MFFTSSINPSKLLLTILAIALALPSFLFINVESASAEEDFADLTFSHGIFDGESGFSYQQNGSDEFGYSMNLIGDLDQDGVTDIIVGAMRDVSAGAGSGAVYILFMNSDGTIKSSQKISKIDGGFTGNPRTLFGAGVAGLGDVDGDGVIDIAVASLGLSSLGGNAIWVLFMNTDGTVKGHQELSEGVGTFPVTIQLNDNFGRGGLEGIGDLDGDGIPDLAVGAERRNSNNGAVYIFFLNSDGTVKNHSSLSFADGINSMDDHFGRSVTSLGDFNHDGIVDIAVGAPHDYESSTSSGSFWIIGLNPDGTVHQSQKISATQGGLNASLPSGGFGWAIRSIGDFDNDGISDVVVTQPYLSEGDPHSRGIVRILTLNSDGTIKAEIKFANGFEINKQYPTQDLLGVSLVFIESQNGEPAKLFAGGILPDGPSGGIMVFDLTPAEPIIEDHSSHTIIAQNSIHLKHNGQLLSGSVLVNNTNASTTQYLDSDSQLSIGHHYTATYGTELSSDSIRIKNKSRVYDIDSNTVSGNGTIQGTTDSFTQTYQSLPTFHTASTGTQNLTALSNTVTTITPSRFIQPAPCTSNQYTHHRSRRI